MGNPELHRVRFQSLGHVLAVLALVPAAQAQSAHPNYDDDIRPVFARRCFACHNASEVRSGLNLESFAGVLKGGASGDAVVAGRPSGSLLFKAISREPGAPQMPLGGAKLPDAELGLIRDWIAGGLLESASSKPKGPVGPSLDYKSTGLNRPSGAPAMPGALPALTPLETTRANPVTAAAASPWAPLAAIAGHGRIYLYNLETRKAAGELAYPEGIAYSLRFSRDGALLIAAGGKGVQSGRVVLFDVKTGARVGVYGEERDIVLAADLSANGKLLALGGPGKVVKVYAVPEGREVYQLKKHTDWITALEFSPDGTRLATGDRAGGIYLWEAAAGGALGALAEHKDAIHALSWRGDGQLLASGSEDGQIIVWNVADGFPLATVAKAHTPKTPPGGYGTPPGGVLGVQFMPDGRIASVGRDATIRIWSADGKPKGASGTQDVLLTQVATSADGKLILAGDYNGRLLLWDGQGPKVTVAALK